MCLTPNWAVGDIMVDKAGLIPIVLCNGKAGHNQMITLMNKRHNHKLIIKESDILSACNRMTGPSVGDQGSLPEEVILELRSDRKEQ